MTELNVPDVPEESEPRIEDFIPEGGSFELPDPNTVIKLMTSGGDEAYVIANAPMTIGEAMLQSALRITGAVQYWLNGAQVDVNTQVGPGSTVTIVGSVKGG